MLPISRAVAPSDFLNPVGRHDWRDWIDAIASEYQSALELGQQDVLSDSPHRR
jgi:hypothetical protein